MANNFPREQALVSLLCARGGFEVAEFVDPENDKIETGVDVIARLADGRRIGVQVSEIPTLRDRGVEKRAAANGSAYAMWAQNDLAALQTVVAERLEAKARSRPSTIGFSEIWLALFSNIPEAGAAVSTMILPDAINLVALRLSEPALIASNFERVFIHPIMSRTLLTWTRETGWQVNGDSTVAARSGDELLFDVEARDRWLVDPEGECDREIERVLRELRA